MFIRIMHLHKCANKHYYYYYHSLFIENELMCVIQEKTISFFPPYHMRCINSRRSYFGPICLTGVFAVKTHVARYCPVILVELPKQSKSEGCTPVTYSIKQKSINCSELKHLNPTTRELNPLRR